MRFLLPLILFAVLLTYLWFSKNEEPRWQAPPEATLQDYLFAEEEGAPKTDALLIWKDGKLLTERYNHGYDSDSPHLLWSISKSITSTLVGLAIHEGRLKKDDPISLFLNKEALAKDPAKGAITVANLLSMSSGLNWQESYEHSGDRTKSSVGQMLYGAQASEDMVDYTLSHPLIEPPGTRYNYSTGEATVLVNVLKSLYGDEYPELPWAKLFDVLGMKDVTFEQDQSQQFVGGSSVYMRPLDLLRYGELHLNNGKWQDRQLLPPDWNEYVWTPNPIYYKNSSQKHLLAPGRHWWTNSHPETPNQLAFESLPKDTVFALGHWGQYLIIIPSLKVIVVRLGEDLREEMDETLFFNLVAKEIKGL